MSYITVIGAGSWGTTLACLLAEKGYDTSLWVYEESLSEEIKGTRVNSIYLPDVKIHDDIKIFNKIENAVKDARYIVNAVPVQHIRCIFKNVYAHANKDAIIVSVSKGIEKNSLDTPSKILNGLSKHQVAVLSGPSFAKEVIQKMPTAVTIASDKKDTALILQEVFNTDYFRVYKHDDVVGVELGGALKNVMAIASGICDGLGLGNNARAALITRGLAEMRRIGAAMGAKKETFSGLSGLGDLVLTCTGSLSRNYNFGIKLAGGMKTSEILSQMKMVAEGVATAESAHELAKKHKVEMPIVEQVYNVLYKDKNPALAVNDLMTRALKAEFY
ncbi:MAG: NAD(P)-dependent glycerol-3-phosphate dehydrogenase [Nitrospiraceae bacterium]|nr:NAD(P)-dependent glycerol-3-phosphate dehydrogenase [Nitrospiraceae bacterium]